MGPTGTITRLHYDAGSAHGWLGQVKGQKLFILFPPSDASCLAVLPNEPKTQQSRVDPLSPTPLQDFPELAKSSPRYCVLSPGDALLVPQGWWHYAVGLEPCITVMRNFYHKETNLRGMADLVMDIYRGMLEKKKQAAF